MKKVIISIILFGLSMLGFGAELPKDAEELGMRLVRHQDGSETILTGIAGAERIDSWRKEDAKRKGRFRKIEFADKKLLVVGTDDVESMFLYRDGLLWNGLGYKDGEVVFRQNGMPFLGVRTMLLLEKIGVHQGGVDLGYRSDSAGGWLTCSQKGIPAAAGYALNPPSKLEVAAGKRTVYLLPKDGSAAIVINVQWLPQLNEYVFIAVHEGKVYVKETPSGLFLKEKTLLPEGVEESIQDAVEGSKVEKVCTFVKEGDSYVMRGEGEKEVGRLDIPRSELVISPIFGGTFLVIGSREGMLKASYDNRPTTKIIVVAAHAERGRFWLSWYGCGLTGGADNLEQIFRKFKVVTEKPIRGA